MRCLHSDHVLIIAFSLLLGGTTSGVGDEFDFVRHDYPGPHVAQIVPVDFDGDGVLDLVTVDDQLIAISPGKGDGLFDPAQHSIGDYSYSTAVGDFDNDGLVDVVWGGLGTVGICFNNGDGTLSPSINPFSSTFDALAIACADFDGDGYSDVAFGGMGRLTVYLGNGDRNFSLAYLVDLNCSFVSALRARDVDNDGAPDLVGVSDYQFFVTLGDDDGGFSEPEYYTAQYGFFCGLALADLNGDGIEDVVVGNDSLEVFPGLGDGVFSENAMYQGGNQATCVNVGDLDGDGIADLTSSHFDSHLVSVSKGLEQGGYDDPNVFHVTASPWSHSLADLNQDGRLDIVTADLHSGGGITVLLNHTGTLPGDVNLDGDVNLLDKAAFADRLVSGDYQVEADVNRDGAVNLIDVSPFIDLLVD